MPRGHLKTPREFRPVNTPGGSKPGKPQNKWPMGVKVAADAMYCRLAGGMESLLADRDWAGFGARPDWLLGSLDKLLPGVWEWVAANHNSTKEVPWYLLHNRVYKQYYSGTSARRGRPHDPKTRAAISNEHWHNFVPVGSYLYQLHDQIVRGVITQITDWKSVLLPPRDGLL